METEKEERMEKSLCGGVSGTFTGFRKLGGEGGGEWKERKERKMGG